MPPSCQLADVFPAGRTEKQLKVRLSLAEETGTGIREYGVRRLKQEPPEAAHPPAGQQRPREGGDSLPFFPSLPPRPARPPRHSAAPAPGPPAGEPGWTLPHCRPPAMPQPPPAPRGRGAPQPAAPRRVHSPVGVGLGGAGGERCGGAPSASPQQPEPLSTPQTALT